MNLLLPDRVVHGITLCVCFLLAGCQTNVSRFQMPGVDLTEVKRLCVDSTGDERRSQELQALIVENLRNRDYVLIESCASAENESGDYLFSYAADWHWDVTHYLVELRVAIYEPQGQTLLAQAHSYQTSLVRKSMEVVVDRALAQLFNDAELQGD